MSDIQGLISLQKAYYIGKAKLHMPTQEAIAKLWVETAREEAEEEARLKGQALHTGFFLGYQGEPCPANPSVDLQAGWLKGRDERDRVRRIVGHVSKRKATR